MDNTDINSAWAATSAILSEFDFAEIKIIAKLAGFNLEVLNNLGIDGNNWNRPSRHLLIEDIESKFVHFSDDEKQRFLNIVIEEILERSYKLNVNYDPEEKVQYYLNRLGWQLIDKKVLPIEVLDISDLNELDPAARHDLIKASEKFRDGDFSGAISSACAAVDSVTARVYREKNLGDEKSTSFQERCNKSLNAMGVLDAIDRQLGEIQWKESTVIQFKDNLKKSVGQAAYVMQTLRSDMSDVHGTKPVIKPLAFDSIKWAQIIVRLLSGRYDY
ncbi:hypothetical protein [Methylomonas koyamae]|uniref:Uncharacterized protein n=1 Tax=Methylomonas koyamae TaxID=702114 RepID=A0A291IFG3_9GAMM|nr:hypothetical protein [Methylomonas koyamae]ATG88931.1 hypothetical protein MKLM6_0656 [Methylomonas koyamae]OAI28539.1 hypothetical protein A1356_06670 [Methylomonas koyamae]WNB76585.1 hypothetical protein RI210_03135 [Methylomonas koyamae]